MEPKIIFEDKDIIVLDKPSGWIVNEADTTKEIPVIQTWLKKKFNYEIVGDWELRSGVVHRLDKETSGILLIAKSQHAFSYLQSQFKNREVVKTYTALVHGMVEPQEGEIDATVGRLPWNRERFGVLAGGREAVTRYRVISNLQFPAGSVTPLGRRPKPNEKFTLLELYPKSGRTHQIRIHAKYLGYPIVSDEFYAGRKTARKDRKWCPRLFLHASNIVFAHPNKKKKLSFKSPLPADLSNALASLEKLPQTP